MRYGLIGGKLGHSFSVNIHNAFGNPDYELLELAPEELQSFIREKKFLGINVTIPYKESVIPLLDWVSPEAEKIGAVNTVLNEHGMLKGYNTDFSGMKTLAEKEQIDFSGKIVAILGSGGTSKTAFAVAESLGAKEILRVSRRKKEGFICYDEAEKLSSVEVIINATPCGMFPENDSIPVEIIAFPKLCGVIDAVYNPLRTRLVSEAKAAGIKAAGGLYMLVYQAAAAEEIFFGEKISPKKIDGVYESLLAEKENIVFSGMPGCGKTTLGKELAKRLGRDLLDIDALIEQKAGKPITEIFRDSGEAFFRAAEKAEIADAAKLSGKIISLGGGAILDPENVKRLKQNGKIIFLNRPLEELVATSSRPLSADREALEKRFRERFGTYCETADVRLEIGSDVEENIKKILEALG